MTDLWLRNMVSHSLYEGMGLLTVYFSLNSNQSILSVWC